MPNAARGEVWQVDLGLAAKVRPALIVSIPFLDNERAVYLVMPRTTAVRGTRFEVTVAVRWLEQGAFDAQGIHNVPSSVLIRRLGMLQVEEMKLIKTAISLLFDIK